MIHTSRHVYRWLILSLGSLALVGQLAWPVAAQSNRRGTVHRAVPADRSPQAVAQSPHHVAREGLRPLSAELPDTKTLPGLLPPDVSEGLIGAQTQVGVANRGPHWQPTCYHWKASNLCHRPVYFEDTVLERYGQTHHRWLQPAASGARFFLTLPVLPYAMVVNPPRPATSTLGYYRPGDRVPVLLQRPPLQADAGLMEAGAWIGLIFLIP